eukprot:277639-Prorocentrum_minimum.AAC.1
MAKLGLNDRVEPYTQSLGNRAAEQQRSLERHAASIKDLFVRLCTRTMDPQQAQVSRSSRAPHGH